MSIMHVKYAVLLGFLIGLFNIIPYFGAIIGITLSIIITIFTGGIPQALWLALVIIILQQIEGNVIYPRVVGTSVGLPGIWVLVVATLGGAFWGITGIALSVPIASIIYALLKESVNSRLA